MGIWLMALVVHTALGPHDMGVLHTKTGQLVRFPSKEVCEEMGKAIISKAAARHFAGLLDPIVLRAEITCYQPVYA